MNINYHGLTYEWGCRANVLFRVRNWTSTILMVDKGLTDQDFNLGTVHLISTLSWYHLKSKVFPVDRYTKLSRWSDFREVLVLTFDEKQALRRLLNAQRDREQLELTFTRLEITCRPILQYLLEQMLRVAFDPKELEMRCEPGTIRLKSTIPLQKIEKVLKRSQNHSLAYISHKVIP